MFVIIKNKKTEKLERIKFCVFQINQAGFFEFENFNYNVSKILKS